MCNAERGASFDRFLTARQASPASAAALGVTHGVATDRTIGESTAVGARPRDGVPTEFAGGELLETLNSITCRQNGLASRASQCRSFAVTVSIGDLSDSASGCRQFGRLVPNRQAKSPPAKVSAIGVVREREIERAARPSGTQLEHHRKLPPSRRRIIRDILDQQVALVRPGVDRPPSESRVRHRSARQAAANDSQHHRARVPSLARPSRDTITVSVALPRVTMTRRLAPPSPSPSG